MLRDFEVLRHSKNSEMKIYIKQNRCPFFTELFGRGKGEAMKFMKINWGTGIVIALVVMIGGMIYLVSIAMYVRITTWWTTTIIRNRSITSSTSKR